MLQDLKKFLFKDSLIDVAVAFILAAAFGAVVKSLVDDVLMPIIAAIVGQPNFDDIVIGIGEAEVRVGAFLTVFVNFLIVGTVLFFVVRAITRAMSFRRKDVADEKIVSDEVVLLTEIRDSLAAPRR
jgi:large conductance mechanosensitive channel